MSRSSPDTSGAGTLSTQVVLAVRGPDASQPARIAPRHIAAAAPHHGVQHAKSRRSQRRTSSVAHRDLDSARYSPPRSVSPIVNSSASGTAVATTQRSASAPPSRAIPLGSGSVPFRSNRTPDGAFTHQRVLTRSSRSNRSTGSACRRLSGAGPRDLGPSHRSQRFTELGESQSGARRSNGPCPQPRSERWNCAATRRRAHAGQAR